MTEHEAVTSLSDRLLHASREAHALGHHEVAYHALTAAMHAADIASDVRALTVIRREAEAQIAAIDRADPMHRLSTKSAARHSHPGVYAMLVRQTNMHVQIHDAAGLPGMAGWRDAPDEHADSPVPPPVDPNAR